MQERIALSRATVETDHMTPSTPPSNDTNATFHKRTKSVEESKSDRTTSHGFAEDEKVVFRAFKDTYENTENKQIQLASNAVTNDTDNITRVITTKKRNLPDLDFEEIKEEDENLDRNDLSNSVPEFKLDKRHVSEGEYEFSMDGKRVFKHSQGSDFDEDFKNQDTQEDDQDDGDANMLFVEQKFCTVCNLEQPLRTKHCRSCRKCVATYDHHCPWVGN